MYNWIDNSNNILSMHSKSASEVLAYRKGLEIRNRDSKRSLSYYYEDEPQEKWNMYSVQMSASSILFCISSCDASYHSKMSDLSIQVMHHDKEKRFIRLQNRRIHGALNDDSTEVRCVKDRLRNGGCFLSKTMQTPPESALFGLNFDSLLLGEHPAPRYSN